MTAPILDQIRSVAHDTGAATGAVFTDLSDGVIDAFHSFDVDRFVDFTEPFVSGATGTASTLRPRVTTRGIWIGLSSIAAAGIIIAMILRSKRRADRQESDGAPNHDVHREPEVDDMRVARPEYAGHSAQRPESVTALQH